MLLLINVGPFLILVDISKYLEVVLTIKHGHYHKTLKTFVD